MAGFLSTLQKYNSEINSIQFTNQAKQWLNLFLTPSQVNHLPEFIERHRFGLSDFSVLPWKKNHYQVKYLQFLETMKDGRKK
ncbi:9861_t:CDS:2 [Diversispora eburnea]|uniref:9861_t:CDS:1 n=1 Tax=Diversispora eburnea TaxID=1213867 RepID=A0A9N8V2Q0_9GLOM|nr:9861_t:CDS:2 [Diversispora eburnea]